MAGKMIVLEGGEGTGKSLQASALAERLRAQGFEVQVTREPGGTPGAEEIRRLLVNGEPERWDSWTELLLMYAARRDHLEQRIRPALAAGQWVISDRFSDSSLVYQGYAGRISPGRVQRLHAMVTDNFKPDLTLVLDLDPEVGLARAQARGEHENRFEQLGLAHHRRVRDAYREIASLSEHHVLIDATGEPGEVEARLWTTIAERMLDFTPVNLHDLTAVTPHA